MKNTGLRTILDKSFTALTTASVVLLASVLLIVLVPMIYRGSGAVLYKGTVEDRQMQRDIFSRGNVAKLEKETAETEAVRAEVYRYILDYKSELNAGMDFGQYEERISVVYKKYKQELNDNGIEGQEYRERRTAAREIRDIMEEALASNEKELIIKNLEDVLLHRDNAVFAGACVQEYFEMAANIKSLIENIDFEQKEKHKQQLFEIEAVVTKLFGPAPGANIPEMDRLKYGATRWDQVKKFREELFIPKRWVPVDANDPMGSQVEEGYSRSEIFAGTSLEPMFGYVEEHIEKMFNPKLTFYWQFFIDDSRNSHYFGGVGPEILGTLLLTILSMVFVIPLGIISAAFLVECSSDTFFMRIIRMCINTLAGVPSIVFGLFGLAFFVLFLLPVFGLEGKECILAASLTLSVLTLPLMIRATEEAIKTVPQTYKEASLGLGAGAFRTFMQVTLPAALPGILTGVILSLSRVAGETAPILFTGAFAFGPLPKKLTDATRTLSYGSYDMAVGDKISMLVPHQQYGMVVTLILLVLILNGIAIYLRTKVSKRLRGQ